MSNVQKIVVAVFVLLVIAALLLMSASREKALMNINYCWDSNGNHYVMPDERCSH